MNAAICDDEMEWYTVISPLLVNYLEKQNIFCHTEYFQSGNALLAAYDNGNYYDLIILDIFMNGVNGMDTATALRSRGCTSSIVFLTTSRDFAVESYQVHALSYLLKPLQPAQFAEVMRRFTDHWKPVNIQIGNCIFSISDLVFAESYDKKVIFHFKNRAASTVTAKLNDICLKLPYQNFLRCHRSYLVNLDYVKRIENNTFVLTTNEIALITQRDITAIKKKYVEYLTTV